MNEKYCKECLANQALGFRIGCPWTAIAKVLMRILMSEEGQQKFGHLSFCSVEFMYRRILLPSVFSLIVHRRKTSTY
jgi:hypothetical protein